MVSTTAFGSFRAYLNDFIVISLVLVNQEVIAVMENQEVLAVTVNPDVVAVIVK